MDSALPKSKDLEALWLAIAQYQGDNEPDINPDTLPKKHKSKPRFDWMKLYIPPEEYPHVLVAGCGCGEEMETLKDMGYRPEGICQHLSLIGEAGRRGVKATLDDFHRTLYANDAFDAITYTHAIEHAFSPFLVFLEFYRILRDNGKVFIEQPTILSEAGATDHNEKDPLYGTDHWGCLYPSQVAALGYKLGFTKEVYIHTANHHDRYIIRKEPLDTIHEQDRPIRGIVDFLGDRGLWN